MIQKTGGEREKPATKAQIGTASVFSRHHVLGIKITSVWRKQHKEGFLCVWLHVFRQRQ
jgi:hypothetical protein